MLKIIYRRFVSFSLLALFLLILCGSPISAVAQWVDLGLYGGQIKDIEIDPSNNNHIFTFYFSSPTF